MTESTFAIGLVQNTAFKEDKFGFLLPASATIPAENMREIAQLFIPPCQVPFSNLRPYAPDLTVLLSVISESLDHSNFASMRPEAWFDSGASNCILKVLVQPSVPGFHCYSLYFKEKLRRKKEASPEFSCNDVLRWGNIGNGRIFKLCKLYVPINKENVHWILL